MNADRLRACLLAEPGRTAKELAVATGLHRSSVLSTLGVCRVRGWVVEHAHRWSATEAGRMTSTWERRHRAPRGWAARERGAGAAGTGAAGLDLLDALSDEPTGRWVSRLTVDVGRTRDSTVKALARLEAQGLATCRAGRYGRRGQRWWITAEGVAELLRRRGPLPWLEVP